MIDQRFTMVRPGVPDLARAIDFFAAHGSLKAKESRPGTTCSHCQDMLMGVAPVDDPSKDQARPNAESGTITMCLAHRLNSRAKVDAAFYDALAAHAEPLKTPQEVFWEGCPGYFADPDGHLWELAHNPFSLLSDDVTLPLPGEVS